MDIDTPETPTTEPAPANTPPVPAADEAMAVEETRREREMGSDEGQEQTRAGTEDQKKDDDAQPDASEPAQEQSDAPPPPKRPRTSLVGSRTSRRLSHLPPPSPSASIRSRTTRAGPSDVAEADEGESTTADPLPQEEESDTLGRDGKRYMTAGVYWSTGLDAEASVRWERPPASAPTDWRLVEPDEGYLLAPPLWHGETLIDEERPFRLPYDILRDYWYDEGRKRVGEAQAKASREGKGKGGDKTTEEDIAKRENSKKPEPYKYIKANAYVDRKPDRAEVPAICACTPPSRPSEMGCREGCINRLMQYCCDPKLCPCGEQCSNVPLNRREGIPEGKDGLRVIWTGNRGFGLKTMVPIKKGDFVIEYRGEIITRDESYRRVLTAYKDKPSYYFLDYDGHEVIDAGARGNSSRFINHSCGPNLHVVRWRLAAMEEYQMGIFALHDIPAGTELTYDYGWQDFSSIAAKTAAVAAANAAAAAKLEAVPAEAAPAATLLARSLSASTSSSSLSSLGSDDSSAPAPAPSTGPSTTLSTSAILASTDTAIDPARQRCYCGAAECSGFLGGRRKGGNHKKGAAAGGAAAGGPKGKGKAVEAGPTPGFAPPRGGVKVAQAVVTLSEAVSSGGAARRRRDKAEEKEKEREPVVLEKVVAAMRSGRAAAKKALGKLMGGPPAPLPEDEQE
ncbi:hypothetical protein JCM8097_002851 [Rhodosporidiobolus ruineniae]